MTASDFYSQNPYKYTHCPDDSKNTRVVFPPILHAGLVAGLDSCRICIPVIAALYIPVLAIAYWLCGETKFQEFVNLVMWIMVVAAAVFFMLGFVGEISVKYEEKSSGKS